MYIVIEIQNGAIGQNNWTYTDLNQAFAKYHSILAVAATSAVDCHTAVILRKDGLQIACQHFDHGEPEPEPEE